MGAGEGPAERRRPGTILRMALVVAIVAAAGLTAARITRDDPAPTGPVSIPFTERRATYTLDGVIHFGDTTIKTGTSRIVRLVQTDVGFVFTDRDGAIRLTDGKTTRTLAERGDNARLLADGDLAAWEEIAGSGYSAVIQNVRTGEVILRVDHLNGEAESRLPDNPDLERILALDGRFAYFSVSTGLYKVDLDTGTGTRIKASGRNISPVTVADGRYFYLSNAPDAIGGNVVVGPSLDQSVGQALQRFSEIRPIAESSPDGSSIMIGEPTAGYPPGIRDLSLYDRAGRPYPGVSPVNRAQVLGRWLDDTTFTTIPYKGPEQPLDLLTCTLTPRPRTSVTCKTTFPAIAPAGAVQDLVMPDGRRPTDG